MPGIGPTPAGRQKLPQGAVSSAPFFVMRPNAQSGDLFDNG